MIKTCTCGEDFEAKAKNQRYCDDCIRERREASIAKYGRSRSKYGSGPRYIPLCIWCGRRADGYKYCTDCKRKRQLQYNWNQMLRRRGVTRARYEAEMIKLGIPDIGWEPREPQIKTYKPRQIRLMLGSRLVGAVNDILAGTAEYARGLR